MWRRQTIVPMTMTMTTALDKRSASNDGVDTSPWRKPNRSMVLRGIAVRPLPMHVHTISSFIWATWKALPSGSPLHGASRRSKAGADH